MQGGGGQSRTYYMQGGGGQSRTYYMQGGVRLGHMGATKENKPTLDEKTYYYAGGGQIRTYGGDKGVNLLWMKSPHTYYQQ